MWIEKWREKEDEKLIENRGGSLRKKLDQLDEEGENDEEEGKAKNDHEEMKKRADKTKEREMEEIDKEETTDT